MPCPERGTNANERIHAGMSQTQLKSLIFFDKCAFDINADFLPSKQT